MNTNELTEILFPCIEGWGSQGNHEGHAIDIGVLSQYKRAYGIKHPDILACADGVVEFEGYYDQVIRGQKVRPIGVFIRHSQFSDEYDYVSIYWHLTTTCIDKGMTVKRGQVIGTKGNTGYSGGEHLHFTIIKLPKGAAVPENHHCENAWAKPSVEFKDIMVKTPRVWFEQGNCFDCRDISYARDLSKPQVEVKGDGVLKYSDHSFDSIQINGTYRGKYCAKGYYNLLDESNGFAKIDQGCWVKIDGSNVIKL